MTISIDCPDPLAPNVSVGTTFCVRGTFDPPANLQWVRVVVRCGNDYWVGKTAFDAQPSGTGLGFCFRFTGVTAGCQPRITAEFCGATNESTDVTNVTVVSTGMTTDCCGGFNCTAASKLPVGQTPDPCAT
jgi:hypothetical protein